MALVEDGGKAPSSSILFFCYCSLCRPKKEKKKEKKKQVLPLYFTVGGSFSGTAGRTEPGGV